MRQDLFKEGMQLQNNAVYFVSLLLWPILFGFVVGFDKLQGKMWLAFLWPTILGLYGLIGVTRTKRDSKEKAFQIHNEIKANANGLISASFAMGVLLSVLRNNKDSSTTHSKNGARILMISLLMCIAFLLPSTNDEPESYKANLIRNAQQSIFHMAVGLFVAGMFVSWQE